MESISSRFFIHQPLPPLGARKAHPSPGRAIGTPAEHSQTDTAPPPHSHQLIPSSCIATEYGRNQTTAMLSQPDFSTVTLYACHKFQRFFNTEQSVDSVLKGLLQNPEPAGMRMICAAMFGPIHTRAPFPRGKILSIQWASH